VLRQFAVATALATAVVTTAGVVPAQAAGQVTVDVLQKVKIENGLIKMPGAIRIPATANCVYLDGQFFIQEGVKRRKKIKDRPWPLPDKYAIVVVPFRKVGIPDEVFVDHPPVWGSFRGEPFTHLERDKTRYYRLVVTFEVDDNKHNYWEATAFDDQWTEIKGH
jgi:hypothetical protein